MWLNMSLLVSTSGRAGVQKGSCVMGDVVRGGGRGGGGGGKRSKSIPGKKRKECGRRCEALSTFLLLFFQSTDFSLLREVFLRLVVKKRIIFMVSGFMSKLFCKFLFFYEECAVWIICYVSIHMCSGWGQHE